MDGIMYYLKYHLEYEYGKEIDPDDPYAEERSELDDIYGKEDVNLEQLIKVIFQIGEKIIEDNTGYGWAYIIEGGKKL